MTDNLIRLIQEMDSLERIQLEMDLEKSQKEKRLSKPYNKMKAILTEVAKITPLQADEFIKSMKEYIEMSRDR